MTWGALFPGTRKGLQIRGSFVPHLINSGMDDLETVFGPAMHVTIPFSI